MKFRPGEWEGLCQGLQAAEELILEFRRDQAEEHLNLAVWHLWRFAEYAINAVLELRGEKPERHHLIAARVKALESRAVFQNSYHAMLDKLERYRLKADYGSYSSQPSVHYNATNVEDCLRDLRSLRGEVEGLLRQAGQL